MSARLLPLVALVLLGTGCPSAIRINSEPPGARVVVDGNYLGRAPVSYEDNAPVGTSHAVELHLEGYETKHAVFRRNGPVNVGAACAGVVCLWPFVWVQDYPRQMTYLLTPAFGELPPAPPPAAAPAPKPAPPPSDDPLDRPPYDDWEEPQPLEDPEPPMSPPPPPPPEAERGASGDGPAPL